MSSLQYFAYSGFGVWIKDNLNFSQAVRVADRIECSGQGGWDPSAKNPSEANFSNDSNAQIDQAFANVDLNLKDAGGKGWSQVFRVKSYHDSFGPEVQERMFYNFAKWMPDHKPIWTGVGVKELGLPGMKIELEVVAYDPREDGASEKK